MFWVFVFPVLLAAGLGIAFRSRAPERIPVARRRRGAGRDDALAARLAARRRLSVRALDDSAARAGAPHRRGRAGRSARRRGRRRVPLRRRPARGRDGAAPGGRRRAARRRPRRPRAGRASSRCASRAPATSTSWCPGLLGHEPDGQRDLGPRASRSWTRAGSSCSSGSSPRRCRAPQYLASFVLSRLTFLVLEVALLLGFAVLAFGVPVRGSLLRARRGSACSRRSSFAALGLLIAVAAADDRRRVGADEPRDAADVDLLRRVLLGLPLSRRAPAVRSRRCRSPRSTTRCAAIMLEGAGLASAERPELAIIAAWLVVELRAGAAAVPLALGRLVRIGRRV